MDNDTEPLLLALQYLGGSLTSACFSSFSLIAKDRTDEMNSSRSLLSSPLFASSSPNLRSSTASVPSSPSPSSRTSVPMIQDTNNSRASTACHYSPSLVAEEQQIRDGSKDTLLTYKGEKALLELLLDMALDQHIDRKLLVCPETEDSDFESYLRSRVLDRPVFIEEDNATSSASSATSAAKLGGALHLGTPPSTTTMLPKEAALPAEEESASSATHEKDAQNLHHMDPNHPYEEMLSKGQVFVRSKMLLERRSRKRNAPRASSDDDVLCCSVVNSKKKEKSKKKSGRVLDPDEHFKLFLRHRETTEFLTAKEEKHLFSQIQNLMKLEEAQRKLQAQCGRDPTIAEWAQAVGMSRRELQSSIRTGRRCREKMARSNFRLVIHVARKYKGYGLDIQDLVQDGCCGLMKTFEKFNPSKGCRFPTYAYWWIRQSIKKSIFKNSRLIRLPESVYELLRKVGKARMECVMEGEQPTNENVARRAGITTEKLARLRAKTKKPRSMQDRVWSDDDGVTFQEITEDPNVEPPDLSIERLMMRQQVRDFLGILSQREKGIIEHRFGIHDGEPKTLHVIGDMYGLSKERIRQVQNRALDKLKKSVAAQGFDAYFDLLT